MFVYDLTGVDPSGGLALTVAAINYVATLKACTADSCELAIDTMQRWTLDPFSAILVEGVPA